ncbi:MAG: carbohydrate porin [Leptolyngbyaceae cyanobacterium CSU_1_3]|nr:carbohydrate porin [Leptolyngbyaceae cyanobacterium CSU_1_3]
MMAVLGAIVSLRSTPAQASPAQQTLASDQQILAQEQGQLADLKISASQEIPAAPLRQIFPGMAAVSSPANFYAPPLQEPVSAGVSEDELIQKLSGTAPAARPKQSAQQIPVFAAPLPLPKANPEGRKVPSGAIPVGQPVLVTTTTNSDVGLKLIPANQPTQPMMKFTAPSSTVRSINPTPLEFSPTAQTLTLPARSATTRDRRFAQSDRNDAGSLTPRSRPLLRSTALTPTSFTLQGVYLYQGDESSARARLTTVYPLTPRVQFGATFDVSSGNAFTDTPNDGFNVTELYLATSLGDIPNLRFVVGQLDLTSYFDRNSFAKDGATHFFNPVFQTNPALSATGIGSRPGLLVNWSLTDSIEAKAAAFSSSRGLSDFSLDGFAGELGIRYGNLIVRGTYATSRDAGNRDGFREIFQVSRGDGRTGFLREDREESYGINAEAYIPNLKMGIFGRYGRYNNVDLGEGGDTFSGGITFLDLFAPDDRLGLAYGRGLSNDKLRGRAGDRSPDVLELFYDFRFLPNLRVGFSIQERNEFSEIIAGIRVRTEFDVTPRGRLVQ